jgi:hypothetical protein
MVRVSLESVLTKGRIIGGFHAVEGY